MQIQVKQNELLQHKCFMPPIDLVESHYFWTCPIVIMDSPSVFLIFLLDAGALLFFALLGLSGCFITCYDRRVRNDLAQPCRELCLCCCHPGYSFADYFAHFLVPNILKLLFEVNLSLLMLFSLLSAVVANTGTKVDHFVDSLILRIDFPGKIGSAMQS